MPEVMVGDQLLHYVEAGSGDPLLLIHGGGPDGDCWGRVLDLLAARHRAIAYSRRGFHGSPGVAASWEDHVRDAAGLLETLRAAPAVVVGQSAGGIVAAHLAAADPACVRHLVLIEPALYTRSHLTVDLVWSVLRARVVQALRGDEAGAEVFFRYIMGRTDGPSSWDNPAYPAERKQLLLRNAAGLASDLDLGDGRELTRDRLAALPHPVTIIIGELSAPRHLAKVAQDLARTIPHAKLVTLPGSGHAIAFDNPEGVADLISRESARTE